MWTEIATALGVIQLYKLFNDMRNEQRIVLEHETKKALTG